MNSKIINFVVLKQYFTIEFLDKWIENILYTFINIIKLALFPFNMLNNFEYFKNKNSLYKSKEELCEE